MTTAPPLFVLRPVTAQDEPLLYTIYAGTRTEELVVTGWSAEEQDAFLRMQFAAQADAYRQAYTGGAFLVIEVDGVGVGRLYLHRRPEELRIVDLALLPGHRGRGVGSAVLDAVLADADADGVVVSLHVEHGNPARRLYASRGFTSAGAGPVYELLERPVRVVARQL